MMKKTIEDQIKEKAYALGFDACGIAQAGPIDEAHSTQLSQWLEAGKAAQMQYMHNHFEKRTDPTLLVEGAKSVICVALNYYPPVLRKKEDPYISYYAYGEDYHEVMKEKLRLLFEFIHTEITPIQGRVFTDSAPVLERYWAMKSGIGFIGKHTQLIIPNKGSYFFLGELIIDLDLVPDSPISKHCGSCTRCLDHCPTQALEYPCGLHAQKCISYQTIENRLPYIEEPAASAITNQLYGCDICQQICPHNNKKKANKELKLQPNKLFLTLSLNECESLSDENFRLIFKKSAIKRAKFDGWRRNVKYLKNNC